MGLLCVVGMLVIHTRSCSFSCSLVVVEELENSWTSAHLYSFHMTTFPQTLQIRRKRAPTWFRWKTPSLSDTCPSASRRELPGRPAGWRRGAENPRWCRWSRRLGLELERPKEPRTKDLSSVKQHVCNLCREPHDISSVFPLKARVVWDFCQQMRNRDDRLPRCSTEALQVKLIDPTRCNIWICSTDLQDKPILWIPRLGKSGCAGWFIRWWISDCCT